MIDVPGTKRLSSYTSRLLDQSQVTSYDLFPKKYEPQLEHVIVNLMKFFAGCLYQSTVTRYSEESG